jgi:hypothetical protein
MNVCLTIDADWAPPEVLAYAMDRLRETGISYTLFATDHRPDVVPEECEIAWHPNFDNGGVETELSRMASLFPGARGMRPHRLASTVEELMPYIRRHPIEWVSWQYHPHGSEPSSLPGGMVDFPVSWGDNSWFSAQRGPDLAKLASSTPGYYVITFHPVHLFINTHAPEQYSGAKIHYKDAERLREKRNTNFKGVDDVLSDVLELCAHPQARFLSLSEAYDELRPRVDKEAALA